MVILLGSILIVSKVLGLAPNPEQPALARVLPDLLGSSRHPQKYYAVLREENHQLVHYVRFLRYSRLSYMMVPSAL